MRIVIASGNTSKAEEIRRILEAEEKGLEIITLQDLGIEHEVEETGESIYENAGKKLDEYFTLITAKFPDEEFAVIAEDFGFYVDALPDELGVNSKRFSLEQTDETNNKLLLEKLLKEENRNCRYEQATFVKTTWPRRTKGDERGTLVDRSAIGTIMAGTVDTRITEGIGGFAYDKVFVTQTGRNLSMLRPEEKDAISPRGLALRALSHIFFEEDRVKGDDLNGFKEEVSS